MNKKIWNDGIITLLQCLSLFTKSPNFSKQSMVLVLVLFEVVVVGHRISGDRGGERSL